MPPCFNPPPASSAGGTHGQPQMPHLISVSTHPPLHQRGEHQAALEMGLPKEFQPTPRFISGGNFRRPMISCVSMRFNPPPASSAGGTGVGRCLDIDPRVSTHPPLHQRGEPPRATAT